MPRIQPIRHPFQLLTRLVTVVQLPLHLPVHTLREQDNSVLPLRPSHQQLSPLLDRLILSTINQLVALPTTAIPMVAGTNKRPHRACGRTRPNPLLVQQPALRLLHTQILVQAVSHLRFRQAGQANCRLLRKRVLRVSLPCLSISRPVPFSGSSLQFRMSSRCKVRHCLHYTREIWQAR